MKLHRHRTADPARDEIVDALRGHGDVLRSHEYADSSDFWRAADDARVDLLIVDAAVRGDAVSSWSLAARDSARRVLADAAAREAVRARELIRLLAAFEAAGVSCLLLKGSALAPLVYRQPHLRRRQDTDVIVDPIDAARATDLLCRSGYRVTPETSGELVSYQRHFDRPGGGATVHALDLHWRVANPQLFASMLDYGELAASRIPIPALGPQAWTVSLEHALLIACIHRVAHHQNSHQLLWLWDIRLLAEALSADASQRFAGLAERTATRAICAETLRVTAGTLGAAAAATLAQRVEPATGADPEASAAFLRSDLRPVDLLWNDLSALGICRSVRLVREHLFPPFAYMRSKYGRWPAAMLPAAYAFRFLNGAPKWFRRPSSR